MFSIGILRNQNLRRAVAVALILLGGLMMFLSPSVWPWAGLLVLGIVVEVTGITLQHMDTRKNNQTKSGPKTG
jgi:fatty acid desaturase